MIRPFHLRDTLMVSRLQKMGTALDVEEQLTHPRTALRSVLLDNLLSAQTIPSTFIIDHVDENGHHLGFAQMRPRPGRPEHDVVFIAPALEAGSGNHAIWQRLLTQLSIQTAEQGNFRLYAGLPIDDEALQVFKHVGFMAYCQQNIYKLTGNGGKVLEKSSHIKLRPQVHTDGWGLQKLYSVATPRGVQNSEGSAQGQWALPKRAWHMPGRRIGYLWEERGEILGAVHFRVGHKGVVLRTLLHSDSVDETENLLRAALSMMSSWVSRPVYLAIREYEPGWTSILPDLGFQEFASQTLVVKPMTVRVKTSVPIRVPTLEAAPSEGTATTAASTVMPQPESFVS